MGKGGKGCQEHVQRTHGQSQSGVGSRVVGGNGGGKLETTVLEQQ